VIDIILTTYERPHFLLKTVTAILGNTLPGSYRLTVSDDCSRDHETPAILDWIDERWIGTVIRHSKREGIVPGFNGLWERVKDSDSEYVCYLQDDAMPVQKGWLQTLVEAFEDSKGRMNVGFFCGFDAPEHPVSRTVIDVMGRTVLLKASTSATNLIATKGFWKSVGVPVPLLNPDGKKRGFPNDGVGSQIDLWLTGCMSLSRFTKWAASPTCSFLQGKSVLVVPGLIQHLGQEKKDSTWQMERELRTKD